MATCGDFQWLDSREEEAAGLVERARLLEQGAQSSDRFVDEGLLIAIEHFIAHGGDKGAGLTLATRAQMMAWPAARLSGTAITCSAGTARICAWVSMGSTSSFRAVSSFSRAASIRQRRNRLKAFNALRPAQNRDIATPRNANGCSAAISTLSGCHGLGTNTAYRSARAMQMIGRPTQGAQSAVHLKWIAWRAPHQDLYDRSPLKPYCRETDLLVPCMKAWISSWVRRPSLLVSIALKMRS
jgi:hypothetical protein